MGRPGLCPRVPMPTCGEQSCRKATEGVSLAGSQRPIGSKGLCSSKSRPRGPRGDARPLNHRGQRGPGCCTCLEDQRVQPQGGGLLPQGPTQCPLLQEALAPFLEASRPCADSFLCAELGTTGRGRAQGAQGGSRPCQGKQRASMCQTSIANWETLWVPWSWRF